MLTEEFNLDNSSVKLSSEMILVNSWKTSHHMTCAISHEGNLASK